MNGAFWSDDSVSIDFTLRGPVGQTVCEYSATRNALSADQLDELTALELHDAQLRAGCDIDHYAITVHAQNGSSQNYQATHPDCASGAIVLFDDFDAWAQTTPCSSKAH